MLEQGQSDCTRRQLTGHVGSNDGEPANSIDDFANKRTPLCTSPKRSSRRVRRLPASYGKRITAAAAVGMVTSVAGRPSIRSCNLQ